MRAAFDDLQIGKQCTVVQGRRYLTNAAAHGLDGLTAVVGIRGFIALCGGALTHNGIKVKGFAGSKDFAVDGGTGQPEVGVTILIARMLRFERTKDITEQKRFQVITHDSREQEAERNLHGIAILCFLQQFFCCFQIEIIAVNLIDNFLILRVQIGIGGFTPIHLIQCLRIQRIGKCLGFFHLCGNGELVETVSIQNLIIQFCDVQMAAGRAHSQVHDLAGGIGIELGIACIQNGDTDVKINGGGNVGAVEGCAVSIQFSFDVLQIQVQVVQQRNMVRGGQGCLSYGFPFCAGAGTTVLICGFYNRIHIQLCAGLGGRESQGRIRKFHNHVQFGISLIGFCAQRFFCLIPRHATQIDSGNHNIVEDQFIVRRITKNEEDTDNGADQKDRGHTANRNQDDLTVFRLTGCGSLQFADSWFLTVGGRRNSDRLLVTGPGKFAHSDHLLL